MPAEDARSRFQDALDAFTAKVESDAQVLAAILFGSMAYDEVWDQSDIDVYLVVRDETAEPGCLCLVENGVIIHSLTFPRNRFKTLLEGQLRGGFWHSIVTTSKLLFCRDDAIAEYYHERAGKLGAHDRAAQLMNAASMVFADLAKAEKWLYVKRDVEYSFVRLLRVVEGLARIEVLENGEVVRREVIQQALRFHPDFFRRVYTDLIQEPKDEPVLREALSHVHQYLEARIERIFGPVFDYLAEAHGPRTATDLSEHFERVAQAEGLMSALEWLSDHGYIDRVSAPVRLTRNSRVSLEEAAYYFDPMMRG